MNTGDLIALGGAGLLGLLLYKRVDDTLEDLSGAGDTIISSYENLTENIKNGVTNTTEKVSNYFPYLGGDPNLSPQEEAFFDMEKTPVDQAWLDEKTYSASGYRDVSQIGENIKHTDTEKLDNMRDIIDNREIRHAIRQQEIRTGQTVEKVNELKEKYPDLSPMAAWGV